MGADDRAITVGRSSRSPTSTLRTPPIRPRASPPTADDDWLANYGRVNDPVAARAVLEGPATVGFVSIGVPAVAIGRIVVTGEWAGIACVEVSPENRRQGLARRIVETSLAWAVERGADKAYLQTMHSNHAAIALYKPYGFVDHHDYRYLEPGDTDSAQ